LPQILPELLQLLIATLWEETLGVGEHDEPQDKPGTQRDGGRTCG
jgi:hypothetical protein